jgi:hypothetical protein
MTLAEIEAAREMAISDMALTEHDRCVGVAEHDQAAHDRALVDAVFDFAAATIAEHAALHRYLAGLLSDQTHRAPTVAEYQDLVSTHDAVCTAMEGEE